MLTSMRGSLSPLVRQLVKVPRHLQIIVMCPSEDRRRQIPTIINLLLLKNKPSFLLKSPLFSKGTRGRIIGKSAYEKSAGGVSLPIEFETYHY